MTITPEERQEWRELKDYRIVLLIDALEKTESERDAYIRETGKYARECGLLDAEIAQLKERAEKAERKTDVLIEMYIQFAWPECRVCAAQCICAGQVDLETCRTKLKSYVFQCAAQEAGRGGVGRL